jgi:hypothetical protein
METFVAHNIIGVGIENKRCCLGGGVKREEETNMILICYGCEVPTAAAVVAAAAAAAQHSQLRRHLPLTSRPSPGTCRRPSPCHPLPCVPHAV